MEHFEEFKTYLSSPKQILIVTHRNPDGDAIGSTLAMYHYLCKLDHKVRMVFPSEYPAIFDWMPAIDDVLIYDQQIDKTKEWVSEAELVICLDFNGLDRIDKVGDLIRDVEVKKCMIDHHLDPDDFADFTFSDPTASSTCEMVFRFIQMMDHDALIDQQIGECIYTGILTDTGSYKYATSPRLFKIAADLLEKGVDDYKLQDLTFNSLTEKQLRLLGHCLNNRMEILEEYSLGLITLSRRDYEHFDIQRGDTEGIVNYLLKIRHIKMAAFITEQPTIVKLSFRSKGDVDVQKIAQKHFKGGGHKNAAGGSSFKGLRSTVNLFKSVLPQYKEMLTS